MVRYIKELIAIWQNSSHHNGSPISSTPTRVNLMMTAQLAAIKGSGFHSFFHPIIRDITALNWLLRGTAPIHNFITSFFLPKHLVDISIQLYFIYYKRTQL